MAKKKFVHIVEADTREDYKKLLKKIDKARHCPFCPENFIYHTTPILKTGKYWIVTTNMNPYVGTKHHFLFIHRKHIEKTEQMSAPAWQELLNHINWVVKKYKLPAGGFFMRFGDMHYTGSSVAHLHAQMILGSKKNKNTATISAVLGFKK